VVFKVEQLGGAACHTGHKSCFYRRVSGEELEIISEPVFDPAKVYG
jgi:phosphoribosyl-AMP cyclohydrolase